MAKTWQFTPPKWRAGQKTDAWLDARLAEAAQKAGELAASANFTDAGRRNAFTNAQLRETLDGIDERLQKARKSRERIAGDREKLKTAKRYPAATLPEQLMALELARAVRDQPERRAALLRRVIKTEPTEQERRFQVAFLNTFPEVWGLDNESYHIRVEQIVLPNLGADGALLDTEELELEQAVAQFRAAKLALVAASDRDELEKLGVLPRPPQHWSREEVNVFVAENGHEAYQQLLWDESALGASLVHDDLKPQAEPAPAAAA